MNQRHLKPPRTKIEQLFDRREEELRFERDREAIIAQIKALSGMVDQLYGNAPKKPKLP